MPRFTVQAGAAPELDVRPDARRDHHEIRVDPLAVGELDAFDPAVADDRLRAAAEQHANAELLDLAPQQAAADGIDLALHQRVHQVDDGDVAALHLEPARGLEPEQAAADHDRLRAARRPAPSSARVSSSVRNAKTPSRSSPAIGGIHAELPVASSSVSYGVTLPSCAGDGLLRRIDVGHPHADAQPDAVLPVPVERVERDLVGRLLAGEHRRQQDAVVVDVGLVAEDRDVELRRVLEDLLDAGHAGHAVADDDERSLAAARSDPASGSGLAFDGSRRSVALPWHRRSPAAGVSSRRQVASMIACTSGRHDPQPVPARVASHTDCRLRAPASTASTIRALVTPLQSQTRTGSSSAVPAVTEPRRRRPAAP